MTDSILKELAHVYKSDIIEPFDHLIDILGYEGISALSEQFGGAMLYIPGKKTIFWDCIRKQVIKEYNGANHRQLSRKFGICQQTVKNIVRKGL